jgi:hypothetical protein
MYHGNNDGRQTFLLRATLQLSFSRDMSEAPAGVVYEVTGKV